MLKSLAPTTVLIAALCLSLQVQADALADFSALLSSNNRFEASFSQVTRGESGTVLAEVHGELQVQRPNQFYWLAYPPQEQAVISNGETLWVYDIDLEQVTVQGVSDSLNDSPAVVLSGDIQQIAAQFTVTQTFAEGDNSQFQLLPLRADSTLISIDFTFQGNRLDRLWLRDSLGQITVIDLSQHNFEPTFSQNRFEFEAPMGVDVLDQRQ